MDETAARVPGSPQELLAAPRELGESAADRGWNPAAMLRMASGTAILQAGSMAMGFLLSLLLARTLGRAEYGVYALAQAWAAFLALPALLGFDRFLVRGMAVYERNHEWALLRGLLRRTNELVLTASVAVGGIAAAIAAAWFSPRLRVPFMIAMLMVPLTNLTLVRQGAMQALRAVVRGQLPEYLIRPVLILAGVGLLALVDRAALTASSATAICVAGVAVAFVVGAAWLRQALPSPVRTAKPSFESRAWISAALPMMLIAGIWSINNYVSILIVGAISGSQAAGVYNVANTGAAITALVLVAVNMPLAPAIARLHAGRERSAMEQTTRHMARAGFAASVPIAVVFLLLPHMYLGLFGPGFGIGASALQILVLGQLINAAAGPAANVLMMTGHERETVVGVGVGLIANVALCIALVPLLGLAGGAIGASASLALWNAILLVLARRRLGINPSAIGRPIAKASAV